MEAAIDGGARRALPNPMARLGILCTAGGAITNGLLAFFPTLYRHDGLPWMLAISAGLLVFPTIVAVRGRETTGVTASQTLYNLVVIVVVAHFAANQELAVSFASVAGLIGLGGATRLPLRWTKWQAIPAAAAALLVALGTDLTGLTLAAVAAMVVVLAVVPSTTVVYYRQQLEGALHQVRELATIDVLTGLSNRRGMLEQAPQLFAQAARDKRPVAVVMADIDHFKKYNDQFGHLAGDRELRAVASIIQETVRDTDITVRLGGEELCVIAMIDRQEEVKEFAERIRKNVEAATDVSVTLSIGAVVEPANTDTSAPEVLWAMIDVADQLLYQAKRSGRNVSVVAPS